MGMRGINATPKRLSRRSLSTVLPPHPWDMPGLSRAEKVIRFVNSLPCTQGPLAGTTLKLRPWQTKFIRAVYRTDKRGNRAVRTAVLSVSRKNGKTQLAAALCLCALSGPESETQGRMLQRGLHKRPGQARIRRDGCSHHAHPVAEQADQYRSFSPRAGGHGERLGRSRVLAADVAPVMGLSPSFVCYDELGQVPNRELYDALSTALGGRAQPLMLVISTQAASRHRADERAC